MRLLRLQALMALMYPMAAILEGEQGPPAQENGEAAQHSVASGGCLHVLLGSVQAARSACADTDSLRGLHLCSLLLLRRLLSPAQACSTPSRDSAASQGSATVGPGRCSDGASLAALWGSSSKPGTGAVEAS